MAYVGGYAFSTVALVLLLLTTGAAVDRPSSRLGAPPELRAAVPLVLGLGTWMGILFVLAALGQLRTLPMVVAAVALAGLGAARLLRRGLPRLPRIRLRDPFTALLGLGIAVVLGALFVQVLRPIVAWDADVYHLTVPRLWLEHGGFVRIPFNVYSNWPMNLELLFALAMTLHDYVLAKALHFVIGVALLLVVAFTVARRTTPLWGAIAAALLLVNPVLLYEIRVAYVDIAYALFLFVALLAVDRALDEPRDETRWMLVAGISAGIMAGVKVSGFLGVLCLAALVAVSRLTGSPSQRLADRSRLMARPLLLLAGPALLLLLPWLAKSLWLTGNPVYPFLYEVFDGPEWSSELGRTHAAWQRSIGMGREPFDYLLLPVRAVLLGGEGYDRFDGRLHPLWIVLIPVALLGMRTDALSKRALGVAGLYFALWAATSQQMRFLIPVLPLLSSACALSAAGLARRHLPRPGLVARILALALLLFVGQASAHYLQQAPRLAAALWSRGHELRAFATDEVFGFINRELPPDAKLLFLNVNRGFFSEREFIADSFFEASQIAAWLGEAADREGVLRALREHGITHVLVERRRHGPVFPEALVSILEDPENPWIYRSRDGRFTVVELRSAGGGES